MEFDLEKTCGVFKQVVDNEQANAEQGTRNLSIDLNSFLFKAKIDFVTLATEGKVNLPELNGTVCWSVKEHHKAFTVHDPTVGDLLKLHALRCSFPVQEMEVAVDIRPRPGVPESDRKRLLECVMVHLFGTGLYPAKGQGMEKASRSVYRVTAEWRGLQPYNMRLPLPTDQQLHGWRYEDVQVKAYLKKKDQHRNLSPRLFVGRVEVRLSGAGLTEHGIKSLSDLFDFKFRRKLMPYFTHVRSAKPREKLGKLKPLMREFMNKHYSKCNDAHWLKAGVGAFVGHGKAKSDRVRLMRNIEVNDRIGQALNRLEKAYSNSKFVRLDDAHIVPVPSLVRPAEKFGT